MSIHVKTDNPRGLLNKIKSAIEKNEVRTWLVDEVGDFTHDNDQWKYEAWLRPYVLENELVFGIISRKDKKLSKTVYGIYHGRFPEMLLTHFDTEFADIRLSSMPTQYDKLVTNI